MLTPRKDLPVLWTQTDCRKLGWDLVYVEVRFPPSQPERGVSLNAELREPQGLGFRVFANELRVNPGA